MSPPGEEKNPATSYSFLRHHKSEWVLSKPIEAIHPAYPKYAIYWRLFISPLIWTIQFGLNDLHHYFTYSSYAEKRCLWNAGGGEGWKKYEQGEKQLRRMQKKAQMKEETGEWRLSPCCWTEYMLCLIHNIHSTVPSVAEWITRAN